MNHDRTPRTSRLLLALPAAALAFSLAACAAPAQRPSVEEITAGWQQILEDNGQGGNVPEPVLECMSEALIDSDLSDEDLRNIADGKDVQTSEEARELLSQVAQDASGECLSAE